MFITAVCVIFLIKENQRFWSELESALHTTTKFFWGYPPPPPPHRPWVYSHEKTYCCLLHFR